MDFDLANKHKREVDQRRKDAKRKLEQQKRDDERRAGLETEQRAREANRHLEAEEARARAELELNLNEGIRYTTKLKPYPSSRTDDKLELPSSALQELESQGAIEKGTLLTFAVSLPTIPSSNGDRGNAGRTYAGVAEFTAEEGTVGVPPRVALCLVKNFGLESLASVDKVEVRYLRLPRCMKSRVRLQPRGEGFHAGGMDTVRMDLERVLQEALKGHTALSEGDWLPIRHGGTTYELVVKELEPESQLSLLDTDLTVEILPSEQTEAEMRAEEKRNAREEAAAREAEEREQSRLARAHAKAQTLPSEPEAGPDVVQIMIRLPPGGRICRRFLRPGLFADVLTWVESVAETRAEPDEYRLVQKWPGHCKELGPAQAAETLMKLGMVRQEALFLQHTSEANPVEENVGPEAGDFEESAPTPSLPSSSPSPAIATGRWVAAEGAAHQALDKRLDGEADTPTAALREPSLEEVKGPELVSVFERLVALGLPPPEAAETAKKYAAQLKELGDMGFEDWLAAAKYLKKYNGRLVRVVNALSEMAVDGNGGDFFPAEPGHQGAIRTPSPPALIPVPAPVQAPVQAPVRTAAAAIDKEAVAAKFQEFIAAGVEPNDAATQAIQFIRARDAAAADAPSQTGEADSPAEGERGLADDPAKLSELVRMGFSDEARNRELLRKYGGRMERVVEALCSG